MPKAYSEDLTWRAVWLHVVCEMSPADIANVLFMAERSVYRYLVLFHATGSVEPKEHNSGPDKVLNDLEQFTIMQSLIHKPTLYLSDVQEKLFETREAL